MKQPHGEIISHVIIPLVHQDQSGCSIGMVTYTDIKVAKLVRHALQIPKYFMTKSKCETKPSYPKHHTHKSLQGQFSVSCSQ